MASFIAFHVIWIVLFIIVFVWSRKKFNPLKAFTYVNMTNVVLAIFFIWLWFIVESDGFSQVFGMFFFLTLFTILLLISGISEWMRYRKKDSA